MTSKLIPANPSEVMVIRTISPRLVTLSTPFLRFGRIKVGGRATIAKLSSGSLAIFSPVALTPEVKKVLVELGNRVEYIIAADLEHHIFLGEWHAAYPDAKVLAPEGLKEKRVHQENENVPFAFIFTRENKTQLDIGDDFLAELDYEYVDSHPHREIVLYFRPEKTLIEADLFFNLPAVEQYSRSGESPTSGIITKIFVWLWSIGGSVYPQKWFIWRTFSSIDRTAFDRSLQTIEKWDFDRIIPCHGDVIDKDGKRAFRKVLAWHLER